MSKIGELLLIIGTIILIITGFLIHEVAGLVTSSLACFVWGYLLLKLASTLPPKGGDKK